MEGCGYIGLAIRDADAVPEDIDRVLANDL
jgi:hypothetical protein